MAGKNSSTPIDLMGINPLIDSDGDTYKVSSALRAIADLLREEEKRETEHDDQFGFGIALILETCAAALNHMGNIREVNHG